MSPFAAPAPRAVAGAPHQARAQEERGLFFSCRWSGARAAPQADGAAAPLPISASFGVWPRLRPSQLHIAAIGLPEAAHGGFGDAVVVGADAPPAHFPDQEQIRGAGDPPPA